MNSPVFSSWFYDGKSHMISTWEKSFYFWRFEMIYVWDGHKNKSVLNNKIWYHHPISDLVEDFLK